MPPKATSSCRLIVEGRDDKWSVIELLKRHGFDWDANADALPYVHDSGGVEPLLAAEAVSASLKTFRRLGWVLDADLSPTNRWLELRRHLAANGVAIPEAPQSGGAIAIGTRPGTLVGIWLMPNNQAPGYLEDFLARLIPATCPCWPHAQESTLKASALGAAIQQKDHSKGFMHAWLAWQEPPGLPFGTALTAHVLGHESPESAQFVAWFKKLFVEPVPASSASG